MSVHEYAFTLTPGGASRGRSLTIACVAIAAVCVLSSAVVMRELVGSQPVRAATAPAPAPAPAAASPAAPASTTARTWPLEPRWWPGEIRQSARPAPTVPDSELTFTKGYQLRLATRQGTQPAAQPATPQVGTTAPAESPSSRTAATARKPNTVAHTDMPEIRRVSVTPANPLARFDVGTRALAYDEQRPGERGFTDIRRTPPRGLFGTLY